MLDTEKLHEVRFIPNNISFQASLKALKSIEKNGLTTYFAKFEDNLLMRMPKENVITVYSDDNYEWFNGNIASNAEQKLAIKNIVNGSSYPSPYCIFGPPGKIIV
jgi:hypothetical protein